jgi:hypothetical protein
MIASPLIPHKIEEQGVSHNVALPFKLKSILGQKRRF